MMENEWIFLLSKEDTLLLRDHTGITSHHTLPRSGILTLPLGSSAFTSDSVLHAGAFDETHFNYSFHVPDIVIPQFQLPQVTNFNFTPPQLHSLDIAELHDNAVRLQDAQSEYNQPRMISDLQ